MEKPEIGGKLSNNIKEEITDNTSSPDIAKQPVDHFGKKRLKITKRAVLVVLVLVLFISLSALILMRGFFSGKKHSGQKTRTQLTSAPKEVVDEKLNRVPSLKSLECLTGVAVPKEETVAGNEEAVGQGIEEIRDELGIKIIWQLFDQNSSEKDWISYFQIAREKGVQVLAAVADSKYVPEPCNQKNDLRCDLGIMGEFLKSVRDNPEIYDGVLYGFLLIDEPYKDIKAQQVRWMYEDAKAIVDVPLAVGWSREIWKFDNNPNARFSDGMCDLCLISALEFRNYGEGDFFDKETLIANQTFSRSVIRERDPGAMIISSVQVFGSGSGGSTYYMPTADELREMMAIMLSDELEKAGSLDVIAWQSWKAMNQTKFDYQDNLSDSVNEEHRQIVRDVCGE